MLRQLDKVDRVEFDLKGMRGWEEGKGGEEGEERLHVTLHEKQLCNEIQK